MRKTLIICIVLLAIVILASVGYNIYRYPAMFRSLSDESLSAEQMEALRQEVSGKSEPKVLVAYFSYSGNTRQIAVSLIEKTGADLFEITTQEDYSNVYTQSNSEIRKNARPVLKDSLESMEQYDIVFVGFPVWWHSTPAPVNTFLESYDLTEKLIVPFCTSSESDISEAMPTFLNSCNGLAVYGSKRIAGTGQIDTWLTELELNITANEGGQNEKIA